MSHWNNTYEVKGTCQVIFSKNGDKKLVGSFYIGEKAQTIQGYALSSKIQDLLALNYPSSLSLTAFLSCMFATEYWVLVCATPHHHTEDQKASWSFNMNQLSVFIFINADGNVNKTVNKNNKFPIYMYLESNKKSTLTKNCKYHFIGVFVNADSLPTLEGLIESWDPFFSNVEHQPMFMVFCVTLTA